MILRCKKSLYKSTFKKNAFKKGKSYELVKTDEHGLYFRDEVGQVFGPFIETSDGRSYVLGDYFTATKA